MATSRPTSATVGNKIQICLPLNVFENLILPTMNPLYLLFFYKGGIKAVLWTDSLQMLLMIATIVSVVIKGAVDIGFEKMWQTAAKGMRTDFFR